MWDNRQTKTNPKAPDFKCRDRACDGVVWPPKNGKPPVAAASAKQPQSAGPHIPGLDDEPDSPLPFERLDRLFNLYDLCFAHAHALAHAKLANDASHEGISAMAATVFIAAKDLRIGQ